MYYILTNKLKIELFSNVIGPLVNHMYITHVNIEFTKYKHGCLGFRVYLMLMCSTFIKSIEMGIKI
jgi:hypothetical protein